MADTRKQVRDQCRAVAHLANCIAQVHIDKGRAIGGGAYTESMLEFVGKNTAHLMEVLGNILNDMDAVDEDEDAWLDPIFKEAHRLWPDDGFQIT